MAARNLELARAVYRTIRNCWVAGGSALEAHERLSLITVAAGLREFAFLSHGDTRCPSHWFLNPSPAIMRVAEPTFPITPF